MSSSTEQPVVIQSTDNSTPPTNEKKSMSQFYYIFHIFMVVIAIYISSRCNETFDFASFLTALCCTYLYIIYTASKKFCLNN